MVCPLGCVAQEEHSFQAETRQLLDIVTNSLYTDKEVFLRELISNASDSLEKLRHLQVSGAAVADPDLPLEITLDADKEKRTITITDTGVGLTRDEMVSLLGTIARSGSKAFVAEAKSTGGAAESIIGQFGVGFYSAFMVGTKVDVASTPSKPGEVPHLWSSEGAGSYTIAPLAEAEAARGVRVTIHLKDDQLEYLEASRLREVRQERRGSASETRRYTRSTRACAVCLRSRMRGAEGGVLGRRAASVQGGHPYQS